MLTEPITLRGRVNGQPITWKVDPNQLLSQSALEVVLAGRSTAEGLLCTGKSTVEYDGIIVSNPALEPQAAAVTIDELILEVPLPTARAISLPLPW